jgi:quinolinate synthase
MGYNSSAMALANIKPAADRLPPPDQLDDEIRRLKKERKAVILAHYYQESEIQDLADHVGDSLQLSQAAAKTDAEVIAFAGVHFMAETAKILNPDKIVVVPDLDAGCSLADGCPAPRFAKWLEKYPGHKVVSYINCSAEVKAMSDLICTSSNAVKMVQSFPREQKLVFAPDRHLGAWVMKQTGRDDLVLWPGTCIVHETFSEKRLLKLMVEHPEAEVIAHPECEAAILSHAHYIGSTSALISYAKTAEAKTFIVATEVGILHKMQNEAPDKLLIAAPPDDETCACNVCPHMKRNTPEKLYLALRDLAPRVEVAAPIRARALAPIQRMLELSR